MLDSLPPLSLYIHIPWCIKKCPYCDFNSHTAADKLPETAYINALVSDLEQALPLIWGRMIRTIFIGGGTPSLMSGDAINQLLIAVRKLTNLSPYAEITIEANPGTVDNSHIADYSSAGVNRISLGIQSFNDKHLESIGRIHDSAQAVNAINIAKKYFQQINLDLMYGLPEQSIRELATDIQHAVSFATSHLSCYNLTIEPNTLFHTKVPQGLPDNDLCYAMQDTVVTTLAIAGYQRYEVSAYAKNVPEDVCAHNLNYWQFGDYLGIGAGAHSKISTCDTITRYVRHKSPAQYLHAVSAGGHILETKKVATSDLQFEFMLNSLRLVDGFDTRLFVERTGCSFSTVLSKLNLAQSKGLVSLENGKVVPTKLGQDFLNDLLLLFLED